MSDNIQKDKKETNPKIDPESLNVMLTYFKDGFATEEARKATLENKASMVLGFSGIIAGLISGLASSNLTNWTLNVYTGFLVASVLAFTISGIYALLTVKLRNYMQPFASLTPEQIDELLGKEEIPIKNEIIKNYSDSLLNNQVLNNQKAGKLNIAFYGATLGIFLTLIAAIFGVIPGILG